MRRSPVNWEPRYAIAAGLAATVDHREGETHYQHVECLHRTDLSSSAFLTNTTAARELFNSERGPDGDLIANVDDQPGGFTQTGNLPPTSNSGVHSLTDVPVYASGPGSEMFRGVYNSSAQPFSFPASVLMLFLQSTSSTKSRMLSCSAEPTTPSRSNRKYTKEKNVRSNRTAVQKDRLVYSDQNIAKSPSSRF